MMKYYSAQKHWRKLKPIFELDEIHAIMQLQMKRYQKIKEAAFGRPWNNRSRLLPKDYDCSDWRCNHRGRRPAYWDWICYEACHWMAPVYLLVIRRALPGWSWSMLSGPSHTTIFCGDYIFDPQYEALGLTANTALKQAKKKS